MTVLSEKDVTIAAPTLAAWAAAVLRSCGVPQEDADIAAKVLVDTNLRGVDTHGVTRLAGYVEKLRTGEANPHPQIHSEFRDGALFVEGDGGLGQVVGMRLVEEAVARVKGQATVCAFVRRSGHLAALGAFALEAARQGMVALFCQETPPLMALPGSSRPSIGNNPIAFAVPLAGKAPLVFDIATSIVSRGAIAQAARDKRKIPADWALGTDGAPTDDPVEALKGAVLPIAGHKGVGLAMMVQVLAGSLTGSMTSQSAKAFAAKSSAGNVSAFLLLLNPDILVGRDVFDAHVAAWLADYMDASGPKARYPGERAAAVERERSVAGIPLPGSVVRELHELGDLVNVPFRTE